MPVTVEIGVCESKETGRLAITVQTTCVLSEGTEDNTDNSEYYSIRKKQRE